MKKMQSAERLRLNRCRKRERDWVGGGGNPVVEGMEDGENGDVLIRV